MVYDYRKTKNQILIFKQLFGVAWEKNPQATAFKEYFERLNVNTYLVEKKYVDKDYLNDYSFYYSKCFRKYKKFCKRIHLFKNNFTETEFINCLNTNNLDFLSKLKENYLGFTVRRPIPARIGRTCLATYPIKKKVKREYPVTREYNVNLYGIELSVVSLAYQQQDGSVAVCATSALWSAANKTGELFHHSIPSPSKITALATSNMHFVRSFPNNGLTAEQLGNGISAMGLEPQMFTTHSPRTSKALIYAYTKAKIPIICGLKIFKVVGENQLQLDSEHAVTVAGYSFENGESEIGVDKEIKLHSSRISKIFCHDDQICPFARMEFEKFFYKYHSKNGCVDAQLLNSNWTRSGTTQNLKVKITILMIPLYNKIRISYKIIERVLVSFESFIKHGVSYLSSHIPNSNLRISIEWEVYLSNINTLKQHIINLKDDELYSDKIKLLTKFYPKYIWRAVAWIDNSPQFELLFDGTDMDMGKLYIDSIIYKNKYYKNIALINRELFNQEDQGHTITKAKHKLIDSSKPLFAILKHMSKH